MNTDVALDEALAVRLRAVQEIVDRFPTQKAFAEALGMSQSRVNKALDPEQVTDRRLAPIEIAIKRMKDEFGEDWPSPEHAAGIVPAPSHAFPGRTPPDAARILKAAGFVRIPSVTVEASAGGGSEVYFEEIDEEIWMQGFVVREMLGVSDLTRVKRIRVTGTSMVETILPGAWLWVVEMVPGEDPIHAAIYIIRAPFGLQVKRLYMGMEADDEESARYYVTVHSDNPEAGRDRVPLEVFRRDYYVVAHVRHVQNPL